jgi:hypothetical protein
MARIVALVTMALLQLLMRRHLRHCQASIVALVAHCQAGILALNAMALLPSICRHLCYCHNCDCCPHDDGIVAVVSVQPSLPSLRWHCHLCNIGIVVLELQWCCCSCCDGVVAVLKLALLPSLQWSHCHH